MKHFSIIVFSFLICHCFAQDQGSLPVEFKYGGYVKADFIGSIYNNGKVNNSEIINDIHLPSQIPVGQLDRFQSINFHAKESRFNFLVRSKVLNKEIVAFLELDFLISPHGNEKVTNGYSPRLRHFYVKWNRILVGQTWSTFVVGGFPSDLDLVGALEGTVLMRQSMLRYESKKWWFAIENPLTTYTNAQDSLVRSSNYSFYPDIVIRRNFGGKNWSFSLAGIYRPLMADKPGSSNAYVTANGFGFSGGGKIGVDKKGSDLKLTLTYGDGLGRYQAANFAPGAVFDLENNLNPIEAINGFVALNYFWIKSKWSSCFNASFYSLLNRNQNLGDSINYSSYSLSANLKYTPESQLMFGIEYMYGLRENVRAERGSFNRIQVSVKYSFGYINSSTTKK